MSTNRRKRQTMVDHVQESNWQFTMARMMQMVGLPAITVLCLFVWNGVSELQKTVAEVQTDVAVLKGQVTSGTDDRYRASTARSDLALRDQRIADAERRLVALERAIETERSERKNDDRILRRSVP